MEQLKQQKQIENEPEKQGLLVREEKERGKRREEEEEGEREGLKLSKLIVWRKRESLERKWKALDGGKLRDLKAAGNDMSIASASAASLYPMKRETLLLLTVTH